MKLFLNSFLSAVGLSAVTGPHIQHRYCKYNRDNKYKYTEKKITL